MDDPALWARYIVWPIEMVAQSLSNSSRGTRHCSTQLLDVNCLITMQRANQPYYGKTVRVYQHQPTSAKALSTDPALDWPSAIIHHCPDISAAATTTLKQITDLPGTVWLGGVVVSALGMRTRRPRFESRFAPLFHWVATLGKLFTHIASPVSQLQETGVQKGVFSA